MNGDFEIEGDWDAKYALFKTSDEREPEELARITLKEGKLFGKDLLGYEFTGEYVITGEAIRFLIKAFPNNDDSESIFGTRDPFTLELEGNYTSPDYFSLTGNVVDDPSQRIVINCSRHNK